MESKHGQGSRFVIRLPLTLAISHALILRANDEFYALLSQRAWLESKVSEGGTALPRVREQLERARAELGG